jgi:hypothetical protein
MQGSTTEANTNFSTALKQTNRYIVLKEAARQTQASAI